MPPIPHGRVRFVTTNAGTINASGTTRVVMPRTAEWLTLARLWRPLVAGDGSLRPDYRATTTWAQLFAPLAIFPLHHACEVWIGGAWQWVSLDAHLFAAIGVAEAWADVEDAPLFRMVRCPVCEGSGEEILFFMTRPCKLCDATGAASAEAAARELEGRRA